MIKFVNYILKLFGVMLIAAPAISDELMQSAKLITAQVEMMGGSGEYRRAQALRALMNRHPEARERECALAIELAL
jgi:hypothetical protein